MDYNIECKCQSYKLPEKFRDFEMLRNNLDLRREFIIEIGMLRDNCRALNEVLLREKLEEIINNTINFSINEKEGNHMSVSILSIYRNRLPYVTSPIHSFLLNDLATTSYKNAISDKWIKYETVFKRQKVYNQNFGKFFEILFAEWLVKNNWKITNLEAWDENTDNPKKNDVEAINEKNEVVNFQVKTLFPDPKLVENLALGKGGDWVTIEIVKARLSDADKAFKNKEGKKVIIIIDGYQKYESREKFISKDYSELQKSDEIWFMKEIQFKLSVYKKIKL